MRAKSEMIRTLLVLLVAVLPCAVLAQDEDETGVRAKRYRIDDNPKLQYELIGSSAPPKVPAEGYKLLVVLPGGDGSAEFNPFVKRIWQNSLDEEYLVIQLIAPKWSTPQEVVWPTKGLKAKRMKVSTEEFIAKAVADVAKRVKIDTRHTFALGWSSGGPAAYTASVTPDSPIRGVLAAMSVFKPDSMPALKEAKDRAYYILHSPEDQVCPFRMAEAAASELREQGAKTTLVTYEGGHGWQGDLYGNIRRGMEWLEENSVEVKR
jgi:predicted esterase